MVGRGLPADSREASVWLDWGTGVPSFFQCQPTAGTPVHQCQPVSSLRLALQCPVSALRAGPQLLSPVPVALSASWLEILQNTPGASIFESEEPVRAPSSTLLWRITVDAAGAEAESPGIGVFLYGYH